MLDDVLDPTDDDLTDEVVEDDEVEVDDLDDWGYAATDDRYEGNGIPSWSAWA